MHTNEMEKCNRMSRARLVSKLHISRKKREREPSRIPYRKVIKLFRKTRVIRNAAKSYLKKCIPNSSKLKLMLCEYNRYYFTEWLARSNCALSSKECFVKPNLYLAVVQLRTLKHKKSPLFCIYVDDRMLKELKQTYHVSFRVISLSGDVEENPGPSDLYTVNTDLPADGGSVANSVSLLETRLSELNRTALDVGAGGDCLFRAVSHQLYSNPNNHFYIRSLGIQYLLHNPEQFIESNTDHSWQEYLNNMSRPGTWADAIIIQAVANCLNLSIHIAESSDTFAPVTVVQPAIVTRECRTIYIGHIGETHYVSTEEKRSSELPSKKQCDQTLVKDKLQVIDKNEKRRAYMKKYMKKRRADAEFRKRENESFVQRYNNNEATRENKNRAVQKRNMTDPEHAKEINKQSFRKRKAQNPELIREINKQSFRKRKAKNPEHRKQIDKQTFRKRKADNPEHIRQVNRQTKIRKIVSNESASLPTNVNDQLQAQEDNKSSMISLFHNNIECGPEYICTCCDQLWYRSSVVKCNANKYKACSQDVVKSCVMGLRSVNDTEWICTTCDSNLKTGKLPSCSKANKMSFPAKPELLNLTPLEERLISPRIPFMQIRELPRGGQLSIHGNIVNVPSDVNSTVHCLPRPINESQTIPIKLKRRLSYKHHYQFQNVRPKKVLDAAKYLVQTSDLFKSEGIEVQSGWIDNTLSSQSTCSVHEDWSEFIQNPDACSGDLPTDEIDTNCQNSISTADVDNPGNENDDSDDWCEVAERPSGVTDTLLQEPDIAENGEKIISFAPGEGNKPLGIFMDKDSEYLSFPTIFCGKQRPDNSKRKVPVSYSTVAKWELRCQDRRAAKSVPNIFYKLKKLQIKQIQDSACISLRKCQTKGKKYTAGDLKSEDYLNKLVHLDEGFRVLRNLRGSPPYFEKCKKDLFAMIRQLGNPTWFCSFSAAETRWTHLLKTLGRIVEKKDYTDGEIKQMTWKQKSDLIQKDPVTCARNFDHMVQLFIRDVLKSNVMPIGEIADFFYRVEFQQRGSPHIHGLFWVKEAPQYEKSSNEEIVSFVDKYITCQKPDSSSEMDDLVNLQMHRHAKTCKKAGRKICRFNFPLPPMPRTMILTPLDNCCFDEMIQKKIKENAERIRDVLDNMKYGEDISFEDFLNKLQLTEECYILAIRHTIIRDTLFLKRAPAEIRINSYNTDLLKAWRANMDMQYVLDPYACATYILSYITKGQRGMSRLLEKASEEAKSGNKDITNRVRHIGNKFLNAVEISAQEAVYLVLQMPMRRSSRTFQFISTSPPDERTFLLKKLDKLKELPDNSPDIESDNIIKRYQRRPKQLEKLCLADFVAWFNCVKDEHVDSSSNDQSATALDGFIPETNFDDNTDDDPNKMDITDPECELNEYKLKGGMKLVKRKKPKIIRSVRYHKDKDPENHYREQLMLYSPWRKESTDLIKDCQTYQERFEQVKNEVFSNRHQYEYHSEILDKAIEDMNNAECGHFDNVAPNAEHINKQDCAVKDKPSELFGCFDPGKNKQHNQYDLLDDIGIFPRSNDQEELVIKRISDNDYYALVRSLNEKQRQFFYHVLHSVKTKDDPLRLFLSGGAGVGKSTVTNALYEALIRYLNSIVGENPDDVKVVKTAPTGKAAFNIKGNTLHAAFKIPANRGFEYCALDSDRLNTIRAHLKKLKVIFIDEISMVGSGMFNFLNLRLQQITGTKEPFGGISLITVGDLFQLKPVFDKWIFENSQIGYNALASNIWTEYFNLFELTEIMRQKDDKQFAELLNRLREGNHSEDDIAILKQRLLNVRPVDNNYPMNMTHLFTTNASVDSHNNALYTVSKTDKAQIKALDIVVGDISDELKKQIKTKIPDDPTKTMGLYSVVSVATEAKYDLTNNIDVTDGLTNGAECVIENIDYRVDNSNRPSIIWVSFPHPDIGKKQRRENSHLYKTNMNINWTPVLEVTRQFRINKKSQVQILRRQFPLRPAAAKTIHRCQGDTLNEAVVDFPASTREHMHYVGLSRVRNSSALHILNLNENKIKVSEKVKNEMNRLRTEASLVPLAVLQSVDSPHTKTILFQNVRSLHLHIDDVRSDYNIQKADVNIFVETKLCLLDKDDAYQLSGFTLFRNDFHQSNIRTCYGTAVYIKKNVNCAEIPYRFNFNNVEITIMVLSHPIPNLHLIAIYRSKTNVKLSKLIDALRHLHDSKLTDCSIPVVLLGDFNVNLMEQTTERRALTKYLIEERGYRQLINQYTTDYRTQIDHIYTNVPQLVQSAGALESYYSDHKPLFISLTVL